MPRYFFHITDDDDEGTEYPDTVTARTAARDTFGAMIRDGALGDVAKMDVVDETGQRVVLLRFSAGLA